MSRPPRSASARRTWRDALFASFVTTLARPSTWAVALAGFLARGGLLLFLAPIVVLPTTASLANVVEPVLRPVFLGSVSMSFVVLAVAVVGLVAVWLVVGGVVGVWADVVLVGDAALDEELGFEVPPAASGRKAIRRALAVRLIAHAPLAAALAVTTPLAVLAIYAELTNPGEVVTPLAQRTLGRIPLSVALVVVAWLIGEAAGGLAVRRVVLLGEGVGRASIGGYRDLVWSPASLPMLAVTTLGIAGAVLPAALAAALAWSFTRLMLLGERQAVAVLVSDMVFVVVWSGGLVMAGAAAWRSHAWTAEWLRRHVPALSIDASGQHAAGTIGGTDLHSRGDWSAPGPSGTL